MRSMTVSLECGQTVIRSTIPASDFHCFFGDNQESMDTLSQWEEEISKSLPDVQKQSFVDAVNRIDHLLNRA